MLWIQFTISAVIIFFAGKNLAVYADLLSDRYGWGKVWIGVVLLGLVTSLPEVIASMAAIVLFQAPDLALGNLLGSNLFNPMIIVIMDALDRQGSVTDQINLNRSHKLSMGFAVLLTLCVIGEIFLSARMPLFTFGRFSAGTILIAVLYFWGVKVLFSEGKREVIALKGSVTVPAKDSGSKIFFGLLLSVALVVAAAIWLTQAADKIAYRTGLGQTFVGSIFMAFTTSLPEIVVSMAALRMGAMDLAVGNIFGSNMVNMFIVFLCAPFYSGGPILGFVSQAHIFTGIVSIVLTIIVLAGIKSKSKKTLFSLGWDSILLMVCFLTGMRILYQLR